MSTVFLVLPLVASMNQFVVPGDLHVVDLNKPATVYAHVGDLIQLEYRYAVTPKTMPRALKVDVAGLTVRGVRVVNCPAEPFGAGCTAAVLTAISPGESVVSVTPVGVEGAKPIRVKVVVRLRTKLPPTVPMDKQP
jgi:hypothetical protein